MNQAAKNLYATKNPIFSPELGFGYLPLELGERLKGGKVLGGTYEVVRKLVIQVFGWPGFAREYTLDRKQSLAYALKGTRFQTLQ
jgi:hypothetical protein